VLSLLAVAASAGSFVCLFLPWLGFAGHAQAGWNVPLGVEYGLVALALVLVELLTLGRAWTSRGSVLATFCLVAGAGVLGVSMVANLRWGGLLPTGFSAFEYGAWLGLAFSIVLIGVAAVRLGPLWRSAP
jgi:hypothetical protein